MMILLLAIFFIVLVVIWCIYFPPSYLLNWIASRHSDVLFFAETTAPVISLTIDDAPSENTSAILDCLAEHNVQATFFIISSQIKGNEEVMKRIVSEGHVLGNHLTEDFPSIRYSPSDFKKHMLSCSTALDTYQESKVSRWLRPGSGWFNDEIKAQVAEHDHRLVLGNVYPHDAQVSWPALNSWFIKRRTTSGSVLILHDRHWTIPVLDDSLPTLCSDFKFVSLSHIESKCTRNKNKRD